MKHTILIISLVLIVVFGVSITLAYPINPTDRTFRPPTSSPFYPTRVEPTVPTYLPVTPTSEATVFSPYVTPVTVMCEPPLCGHTPVNVCTGPACNQTMSATTIPIEMVQTQIAERTLNAGQ